MLSKSASVISMQGIGLGSLSCGWGFRLGELQLSVEQRVEGAGLPVRQEQAGQLPEIIGLAEAEARLDPQYADGAAVDLKGRFRFQWLNRGMAEGVGHGVIHDRRRAQ